MLPPVFYSRLPLATPSWGSILLSRMQCGVIPSALQNTQSPRIADCTRCSYARCTGRPHRTFPSVSPTSSATVAGDKGAACEHRFDHPVRQPTRAARRNKEIFCTPDFDGVPVTVPIL